MSPGRREIVDLEHRQLPIVRQCALLGVSVALGTSGLGVVPGVGFHQVPGGFH